MLKRTLYTKDIAAGEAVLSGWVSVVRDLGSVKFIILRDTKGKAQITLKKGVVDEKLLEVASTLNQEDVISVRGDVVERKNAPNGMEIIPKEIEIVNRTCERLLHEWFHSARPWFLLRGYKPQWLGSLL